MLHIPLAAFCLFTPPKGWEMAHPKTLSKSAICGFIDKGQAGFCPSLHLTHEAVSCSMDQYLKAVYQIAKSKKRRWRKMGEIETQSGRAHLVEIELNNQFGRVALMQAILQGDGEVHILTAGVLKRDLPKLIVLFQQCFRSMQIVEDLFSLARDPEQLSLYWKKRGKDLESYLQAVLREDRLGPVYQIH